MSQSFRKLITTLVLSTLFLSGASLVFWWLYATRPEPERLSTEAPPPLVRVYQVRSERVTEFFHGYGTARADLDAALSAEVNGLIVSVPEGIRDGVAVAKGQTLLKIDDRDYQQQVVRAMSLAEDAAARIEQLNVEKSNAGELLAIARKEVAVNREELDRLRRLFEQGRANRREVDLARLTYEQSRRQAQVFANQIALIEPKQRSLEGTRQAYLADAQRAKLMVDKCIVKAPFSGQLVEMLVDVGDQATIGRNLARVVSIDRIEVPLKLPASAFDRVRVGAACVLSSETRRDLRWEGHVARVAPVADPNSRTFSVYLEVLNDSGETPLWPGQFVFAEIEGPTWPDALAVPRNAIVDGHVFVASGTAAGRREITVERFIGDRAVVRGDIAPGDLLILTNLDVLTDRMPVRVHDGGWDARTVADEARPQDLKFSGRSQ